jgi:hypothetical protein
MSTTDHVPAAANGNGPAGQGRFESCETCGSPLDHKQRYCVNCATRRPDPSNPTTRYFAAASRRARRGAPSAPAGPPANAMRAAVVMLLVLLPAAVGIGVLVGRNGGGSGADPDLIAALDRQAAGTAAASTTDTASSGTLTSDFSLDKGYAVQIDTLPAETQQADADAAKKEAESKGAEDVGILVPSEFRITPDPGGVYVLYSGEFESKSDAQKALAKLKGDFADATVIKVDPADAAGGGGNTDPTDGAGGKTVAKTKYGDVHQIEDLQPTDADKNEGMQIAQDQANQTGQSYIESQQNLPDVIAVGDAP